MSETSDMLNSLDTHQYDKQLNSIAQDLFGTDDAELDKDRVRLMNWALTNLLLNKGIITQDEFEQSVSEATVFFKLLKRRYKLQNPDESVESTETT